MKRPRKVTKKYKNEKRLPQGGIRAILSVGTNGGIAQLGERLNGIQEVMGSNPTISIFYFRILVQRIFFLCGRLSVLFEKRFIRIYRRKIRLVL